MASIGRFLGDKLWTAFGGSTRASCSSALPDEEVLVNFLRRAIATPSFENVDSVKYFLEDYQGPFTADLHPYKEKLQSLSTANANFFLITLEQMRALIEDRIDQHQGDQGTSFITAQATKIQEAAKQHAFKQVRGIAHGMAPHLPETVAGVLHTGLARLELGQPLSGEGSNEDKLNQLLTNAIADPSLGNVTAVRQFLETPGLNIKTSDTCKQALLTLTAENTGTFARNLIELQHNLGIERSKNSLATELCATAGTMVKQQFARQAQNFLYLLGNFITIPEHIHIQLYTLLSKLEKGNLSLDQALKDLDKTLETLEVRIQGYDVVGFFRRFLKETQTAAVEEISVPSVLQRNAPVAQSLTIEELQNGIEQEKQAFIENTSLFLVFKLVHDLLLPLQTDYFYLLSVHSSKVPGENTTAQERLKDILMGRLQNKNFAKRFFSHALWFVASSVIPHLVSNLCNYHIDILCSAYVFPKNADIPKNIFQDIIRSLNNYLAVLDGAYRRVAAALYPQSDIPTALVQELEHPSTYGGITREAIYRRAMCSEVTVAVLGSKIAEIVSKPLVWVAIPASALVGKYLAGRVLMLTGFVVGAPLFPYVAAVSAFVAVAVFHSKVRAVVSKPHFWIAIITGPILGKYLVRHIPAITSFVLGRGGAVALTASVALSVFLVFQVASKLQKSIDKHVNSLINSTETSYGIKRVLAQQLKNLARSLETPFAATGVDAESSPLKDKNNLKGAITKIIEILGPNAALSKEELKAALQPDSSVLNSLVKKPIYSKGVNLATDFAGNFLQKISSPLQVGSLLLETLHNMNEAYKPNDREITAGYKANIDSEIKESKEKAKNLVAQRIVEHLDMSGRREQALVNRSITGTQDAINLFSRTKTQMINDLAIDRVLEDDLKGLITDAQNINAQLKTAAQHPRIEINHQTALGQLEEDVSTPQRALITGLETMGALVLEQKQLRKLNEIYNKLSQLEVALTQLTEALGQDVFASPNLPAINFDAIAAELSTCLGYLPATGPSKSYPDLQHNVGVFTNLNQLLSAQPRDPQAMLEFLRNRSTLAQVGRQIWFTTMARSLHKHLQAAPPVEESHAPISRRQQIENFVMAPIKKLAQRPPLPLKSIIDELFKECKAEETLIKLSIISLKTTVSSEVTALGTAINERKQKLIQQDPRAVFGAAKTQSLEALKALEKVKLIPITFYNMDGISEETLRKSLVWAVKQFDSTLLTSLASFARKPHIYTHGLIPRAISLIFT